METRVQTVWQKTGLGKVGSGLTSGLKTVNNALERRLQKQPEAATSAAPATWQQFRQWIATVPTVPATAGETSPAESVEAVRGMQAWLDELSEKEMRSLVKQVETFCRSQHVELAWVIDPDVPLTPQMQQELQNAVVAFCLARWHAASVQEQASAFARFRDWQQKPMAKRHQAVTKKLFPLLVEHGLIAEPNSALLLLSEEEKRAYVVEAIKTAAHKDMQAVIRLFQAV